MFLQFATFVARWRCLIRDFNENPYHVRAGAKLLTSIKVGKKYAKELCVCVCHFSRLSNDDDYYYCTQSTILLPFVVVSLSYDSAPAQCSRKSKSSLLFFFSSVSIQNAYFSIHLETTILLVVTGATTSHHFSAAWWVPVVEQTYFMLK